MKKIIFVVYLFFLFNQPVYAGQEANSILDGQINAIDLSQLEEAVRRDGVTIGQSSFETLARNIISGQFDISVGTITNAMLRMIFDEVLANAGLMRNLLIIGILSAFLKNLTDSFQNKSVGELGFYVSYIALTIVLFTSFQLAVSIINDLLEPLGQFMLAAVPVMLTLIVMSGQVSSAFVINPILLFLTNTVTVFIRDIIVPVIMLVASVQIINFLTEKAVLTKLGDLIKQITGWALKAVAVIFIAILTLQRAGAPVFNNAVSKTAKTAVNAVPVVGEILTGSIDTVFYWSSAAKSGIVLAIMVFAVVISAVPVIKLIALIFVYKLTAALIQPVCENRIVKCIDAIASYMALLLGAAVTVIMMFIFSLMITLSL